MKQETIYDRIETLTYEKWAAIILMHDLIAMAETKSEFQKHQLEKAVRFVEEMEKAK